MRHRGLSHAAADGAGEAPAALGRSAMLLEAHLPDRGQAPVPGAADPAGALRGATEAGAEAVRERRVPQWDEVRAVPADRRAPGQGPARDCRAAPGLAGRGVRSPSPLSTNL
ncbi:hypothetical protein [Streptomyces avidinii]|uniref:Uncharacterized protein n=1 Tax=Streptomyces avidinii TaxID=1895 RepID=A0ABS4LC50_STRAV|nr:hypothetical protein [Streptomyces avidinii]GGZ17354.1 hypothetical protein GCM10010343_50690 [Streptomyces avidinii]